MNLTDVARAWLKENQGSEPAESVVNSLATLMASMAAPTEKVNVGADLNTLGDEALRIATLNGFTDATIGEDIALMHSELSEALEDHRAGKSPNVMTYLVRFSKRSDAQGEEMTAEELDEARRDGARVVSAKPLGILSEMADEIIRVLHFCRKHNGDISKAVREKMAYNETRGYHHGGKTL